MGDRKIKKWARIFCFWFRTYVIPRKLLGLYIDGTEKPRKLGWGDDVVRFGRCPEKW
jgi:hypothetical protein